MRIEGALLAYAVLLAVVVPRVLTGAAWAARAPRWGIALWQALSVSLIVAVTGAGLVAVVPTLQVSGGLSAFLQACVQALRTEYRVPGGALAAAAGLVAATLVLARALWCTAAELTGAARERRRHRDILRLIGRADGRLGAVIVEHDTPTAYCLPGRHCKVVLTTATLRSLDPEELDAVLAHERAHLTGRHHLVLGAANGLARSFPFVPLLRQARLDTAVLVEMLADDVAARRHRRLTVASALVSLGARHNPRPALHAPVLHATGTATRVRIERLLAPAAPLHRGVAAGAAAAAVLAVAAPVTLLAVPALIVASAEYCPL